MGTLDPIRQCKNGDLVWYAADAEEWLQAIVIENYVEEEELKLKFQTEETRIIDYDLVLPVNPVDSAEDDSDLTGLRYLHEPGILSVLERRSMRDKPYTFMGSVLVSVNPIIAVKGSEITSQCEPSRRSLSIPHASTVSECAFRQMLFLANKEESCSQAIVIAGESGSGKTETSKKIIKHLVSRSVSLEENLDQRLLDMDPILESFGNSRTKRNPNSSRFGKFTKLYFSPPDPKNQLTLWNLRGAKICSYLLERSRLTFHHLGERTFHVFYEMIEGIKRGSSTCCTLDSLGISKGNLEKYKEYGFRYMSPQRPTLDNEGYKPITEEEITQKDVENFNTLVNALTAVQVGNTDEIFKVLAGILHLGNIDFEDEQSVEGEVAAISSTSTGMEWACKLLGLSKSDLTDLLCVQKQRYPGSSESILKRLNSHKATRNRDSIAKDLYCELFNWLLLKINASISTYIKAKDEEELPSIGVLDIFGFESFDRNCFEQLLINYANEVLQERFSEQILIGEAVVFREEGLLLDSSLNSGVVTVREGQESCLSLLTGPKVVPIKKVRIVASGSSQGILPYLFAVSQSQSSQNGNLSDSKFLSMMKENLKNHPKFPKPHPKDANRTFIVAHYAGNVTYEIGKFIQKNLDRLPTDAGEILSKSSCPLVADIMKTAMLSQLSTQQSKRSSLRVKQKEFIATKFRKQMDGLVVALDSTNCSFIRCVKPNVNMSRSHNGGEWFDRKYVLKQLRCLGIPKTAKVLQGCAFPTRRTYASIMEIYEPMLPGHPLRILKVFHKFHTPVLFCKALFWAYGVPEKAFRCGKTRVFFSAGSLDVLDNIIQAESCTGEVMSRFCTYYIKRAWRIAMTKVLVSKRFTELLYKVRSIAAEKLALKRRNSAILLQSKFRSRRCSIHFTHVRIAIVNIQRVVRGYRHRIYVLKLIEAKIKKQKELEAKERDEMAKADIESKKYLEYQKLIEEREREKAEQALLEEEEIYTRKIMEQERIAEEKAEKIKRERILREKEEQKHILESCSKQLSEPDNLEGEQVNHAHAFTEESSTGELKDKVDQNIQPKPIAIDMEQGKTLDENGGVQTESIGVQEMGETIKNKGELEHKKVLVASCSSSQVYKQCEEHDSPDQIEKGKDVSRKEEVDKENSISKRNESIPDKDCSNSGTQKPQNLNTCQEEIIQPSTNEAEQRRESPVNKVIEDPSKIESKHAEQNFGSFSSKSKNSAPSQEAENIVSERLQHGKEEKTVVDIDETEVPKTRGNVEKVADKTSNDLTNKVIEKPPQVPPKPPPKPLRSRKPKHKRKGKRSSIGRSMRTAPLPPADITPIHNEGNRKPNAQIPRKTVPPTRGKVETMKDISEVGDNDNTKEIAKTQEDITIERPKGNSKDKPSIKHGDNLEENVSLPNNTKKYPEPAKGKKVSHSIDPKDILTKLFIAGEEEYVSNLKKLEDGFHKPLIEAKILDKNEITFIFSNIPAVVKLACTLLETIKTPSKDDSVEEDISEKFRSMIKPIRAIYKYYYINYEKGQKALHDLKKENRKFSVWVQKQTKVVGANLMQLLTLPTQRYDKYSEFFKSLQALTDDEDPMFESTQKTLAATLEMNDEINSSKQEAAKTLRVYEYYSNQVGADEKSCHFSSTYELEEDANYNDLYAYQVLAPGRLYVSEWSCDFAQHNKAFHLYGRKRRERHMLLLTDALFISKKELDSSNEEKYHFKTYFDLAHLKVNEYLSSEGSPSDGYALELDYINYGLKRANKKGYKERYTCWFSEKEERDRICQVLNNEINELKKKREALERMQYIKREEASRKSIRVSARASIRTDKWKKKHSAIPAAS